ncbi:MAG TPA: protein adenylyltransferase SelO family protein, partial [Pseudoxanthomonas sp.]|nr:protein adenylyltransferase SelO family protein [Pseudoxanthomonas sp.]
MLSRLNTRSAECPAYNIFMSSLPSLQLAPSALSALGFDNRFARLPPAFYTRVTPAQLPEPYLAGVSPDAAELIGLDPKVFEERDVLDAFAGNRPIDNAEHLAAVYSGHQFGVWAGQLGDGRALLLGGVRHRDKLWELQ